MDDGMSLLGRLTAVNGAVLALVAILLLATPITIDAPPSGGQVAAVVGGLAAILVVVHVVVRRMLAPLRRLAETIRLIDPDRPGQLELAVPPARELAALTEAFDELLARLAHEQRERTRVALAAQERERLRVARELHDEIGQNLTAITLHAERSAEDGEIDAAAELRRIADDIRYTLDEVRRVARELRPEALDDLGLVNALITLGARVGESGLRVERRLSTSLPQLDAETELVVYRIAQESLTNVVRHARAERVELVLAADAEAVWLVVRDDGAGLPSRMPRDASGIAGMRERALLVGGKLTVSSVPGQGTEVRLEMPIEEGPR
jgi:two-component system sensor histidine kinase UhpB